MPYWACASAACILILPSENLSENRAFDQPSSCHRIGGVVYVSEVGLPLLSLAGTNFARRRRMLHVAESSAPLPVERIRLQDDTRPSGPIVSCAWAVPSAPADCADAG